VRPWRHPCSEHGRDGETADTPGVIRGQFVDKAAQAGVEANILSRASVIVPRSGMNESYGEGHMIEVSASNKTWTELATNFFRPAEFHTRLDSEGAVIIKEVMRREHKMGQL
jgi:hypothetical protein